MNTKSLLRFSLITTSSVAALALVGCNDRDSTDEVARNPNAVPPVAAAPAPGQPTVGEKAGEAWDKTKEASADAWDKTKEVSADAWDKTKDAASDVAGKVRSATSDGWDSIKDATYDDRVSFRTRVDAMAVKLDEKVANLSTRSASLSGQARTEWNDALEDVREARSELKSEIDDLSKASADGWAEAKRELGVAWTKVEMAYDRLELRARAAM